MNTMNQMFQIQQQTLMKKDNICRGPEVFKKLYIDAPQVQDLSKMDTAELMPPTPDRSFLGGIKSAVGNFFGN